MTSLDKSELLSLIEKFIEGEDCSVAVANQIEVAIDDTYPEDAFMQETVLMLASYRPGGGEFLYDEKTLKGRLRKAKERLKQLL